LATRYLARDKSKTSARTAARYNNRVDPFRDELAAAHAKIAHLEEQILLLQEAHGVHDTLQPEPTLPNIAGIPLWAIAIASSFVALGVVTGIYFSITRSSTTPSASGFSGIATAAPPGTNNAIPPIVDPGAVAASSATASAKSNSNCGCPVGDPFCICIDPEGMPNGRHAYLSK
jgi:hypothetical protein